MDSASLLGAAINEEAAYFPAGANLSPYKLVIVSTLSVAVILCCDAICTQNFSSSSALGATEKQHQKLLFVNLLVNVIYLSHNEAVLFTFQSVLTVTTSVR